MDNRPEFALNAVCPYFTMFPLTFPLEVLRTRARRGDWVMDPFCGRGTTNYAARLIGLPTIAIDVSPVATAVTQAKLVPGTVTPSAIVRAAARILRNAAPCDVPDGEFWETAYHPDVLRALCRLRGELVAFCSSPVRRALRAILLGALHGPMRKNGSSSYFSNQSPRTYAPKPNYAVRYWKCHGLAPPAVDVVEIIRMRAERYYGQASDDVPQRVRQVDARDRRAVTAVCSECPPRWIITSPPYYGLRTYVADQWLRAWFLGGPSYVDYSYGRQLSHRGLDRFIGDLRRVWENLAVVAAKGAKLIVRFGAINDRVVDPGEMLKLSLKGTAWQLATIVPAGAAHSVSVRKVCESFESVSLWPRNALEPAGFVVTV